MAKNSIDDITRPYILEGNEIICATDIAKVGTCPWMVYNEKIFGMGNEEDFYCIWGRIEHKIREMIERRFYQVLVREEKPDDEILTTIIDGVIARTIESSYEIQSYHPDLIDNQVKDLRYRLLLDGQSIISEFNSMCAEKVSKKEILESLGISNYVEVGVSSKKLGIKGIVDKVIYHDGIPTPIDYKTHQTEEEFYRHDLQIAAYGMILEEMTGKQVKHGIVDYTRLFKKVTIEITDDLKKEVIDARNRYISILRGDRPQAQTDRTVCELCPFSSKCQGYSDSHAEMKDNEDFIFDRIMATKGEFCAYER